MKAHTRSLDIPNNTSSLIIHELDPDLSDATARSYETWPLVLQDSTPQRWQVESKGRGKKAKHTSAAQHPCDFDQFDGYL